MRFFNEQKNCYSLANDKEKNKRNVNKQSNVEFYTGLFIHRSFEFFICN